jgi:uncharacterized protein DUF4388
MAVEGTLDLFKLPEILQLISQQKKTGILTVQGQQDIVAISFLAGGIVAADALNQTVEEGLAQVLVSEGMMGAQEFARAAAEHQSTGGRLLDLLLERRYVERPQLLKALRLQTYRLLEQLLRWDEGDFKFYSGDEVSYEDGFVPISVEELLIHAVQDAGARETAKPAPRRPVAPQPARPAAPSPVPAEPAARQGVAAGGLRVVRGEPAAAVPPPPPAAPRPVALPVPAAAAASTAERDGLPAAFRRMKVEAPAPEAPVAGRRLAAALAGLAAALLVARLLLAPNSLLLPLPWQEGERAGLAQNQRAALYLKIDRAAKTNFLLEGRFPDHLADLCKAGLLSRADLEDPQGWPLKYSPGEESYRIEPLVAGRPAPGRESTEAITGNFLLDPEFLSVPPESVRTPLVLLD